MDNYITYAYTHTHATIPKVLLLKGPAEYSNSRRTTTEEVMTKFARTCVMWMCVYVCVRVCATHAQTHAHTHRD